MEFRPAPISHLFPKGFSLLELLAVVAILAIIALAALPNQFEVSQKTSAKQALQQIWQLLKYSREQSIYTQEAVTLCPLNAAGQCVSQWALSLTSFIDSNNNAALDKGEQRLRHGNSHEALATIVWRNNDRFIRFNPNGFVNSFGSINFCPKTDNPYSFSLIISRSGRVRSQWQGANCP